MSLLVDTPGSWYADWAWGLPLIVLTVVIHVLGLLLTIQRVDRVQNALAARFRTNVVFVMIVGSTVGLATILHGIEAMIWATTYRLIGALPDYNSAALYSLSAMTSYGHTNLVLEKRWQMLGALEALNGVLLFGLTMAVLIDTIRGALALHRKRSP